MCRNLLLSAVLLLSSAATWAQPGIAIAPSPTTANPAAMLDITSTNKGLLIPRLSTAQRTAIASVPDGLLVYDSTIKKLMYYNQTTVSWNLVGGDSLQIPFRKTFNLSTGGGSGYTPSAALFSLTNNGSNPVALFRQKQTASTRGDALYVEYDGNFGATGYNSALSAYGMNGRYTVGVSAYSDSTAAISAYNLYRGTAIMAQNTISSSGPFAGIASAIFTTNKTLEGRICGIYQDGIESSPIVFTYTNAAVMGYSEAGAGGKFFGADTALHAIGNTYLMGNLRLADGTQGAGKVLRSDGDGNASWLPANVSTVLNIAAPSFRAVNGNGATADYALDANAVSPYNDITIANNTTNAALVASVQLPHGAVITNMIVFAYDNNSTVGIKTDLVATPNIGTGNVVLFSANTGAGFANSNFYNSFTATGANTIVDNATNSYLVKLYPVDASGNNVNWAGLTYIKSVLIYYSYSAL